MNKKTLTIVGVGAGALALTFGAVTFASADDQPSPSPTSSSQPTTPQDGTMGDIGKGGPGAGETLLTGTEAEKVTAAAQAAVPDGTIIRVETDSEGVYEAHVRKTDGTEVIVAVDKDFNVTGTQEMQGRGGPGGPGMNETPLTGDDAEKATAAAEAEFPGGTVLRVETDADGTYEAHVQKADGTEVEVKMDKDFNITEVREMGDHGHGFGQPDSGQSSSA
ncbi:MAG: hypothetical protein R2720_04160 [Candidatus Nanopelagicales bacterium]